MISRFVSGERDLRLETAGRLAAEKTSRMIGPGRPGLVLSCDVPDLQEYHDAEIQSPPPE